MCVSFARLWYLFIWSNTSLDVAVRLLFYVINISIKRLLVKQITLYNVLGPHQSVEGLKKKNEDLQRKRIRPPDTLARLSRLLLCPVDFTFVYPQNYISNLKLPSLAPLPFLDANACRHTHLFLKLIIAHILHGHLCDTLSSFVNTFDFHEIR